MVDDTRNATATPEFATKQAQKNNQLKQKKGSSDESEDISGGAAAGASISGTGGRGAMLSFFREGLPVFGGGGGAEVVGIGAGGREEQVEARP